MYKKFLVSMLLTVALAGCGHQSSDKQTGDQTDTTLPIQEQAINSAPGSGVEQTQQPVNSSSVEQPQTLPPPAASDATLPPSTPGEGDIVAAPPPPPPEPASIPPDTSAPTTIPPSTDNKATTNAM